MKVVVVIDSLKGSLSSIEAGEAAKAGIPPIPPEEMIKCYIFQKIKPNKGKTLGRKLNS